MVIRITGSNSNINDRTIQMVHFNYDPQKGPPWTRVFMEIAVRALIRVHYDFLPWGIPQDPSKQTPLQTLNDGPGLAFADELTVCSAISQNFLMSRFASGLWFDESPKEKVGKGTRHYSLKREVKYGDTSERADFRCERIDPETNSVIDRSSLIEAKRAFIWATKLDDQPLANPVPMYDRVDEDIQALRRHPVDPRNQKQPRGYVLVWNVTDTKMGTDITAEKYVSGLAEKDVVVWQARYVPLAAATPPAGSSPTLGLEIIRWMWVILAEVSRCRGRSCTRRSARSRGGG